MSIPSDFDPLAWGERRYIQPIMTSATTWSNEPSFGMTVTGTHSAWGYPWQAFNDKYNGIYPDTGWAEYGGSLMYYATMTFKHPLKIVGVQFTNSGNAHPRYYDFYGVEDNDTEIHLWHTQRKKDGDYAENMRCENPRYFKRYKFVKSFSEGWSGWGRVFWVKLDAYYRPADLKG